MEKFTIKEALSFGWHKTKKHFWYLVSVLILSFGISVVLDSLAKDEEIILSIIVTLIGIAMEIVLMIITLKILNDERVSWRGIEEILPTWRVYLNYILGSILYGLIVLGGLILLIVPGIIWGLKYSQYAYLIVDKNMGFIEALKESGRITAGSKGKILLLGLSSIGVVLLGALALVVGLLWAIPTAMIAWAYVYRKLADSVMPAMVPTPAPAMTSPVV